MMWSASVFVTSSARNILLLLICLVAFLALPGRAGSNVPLAWDPSADSNVAGYKIYYGVASHSYTSSINVGHVTSAVVTVPSGNKTYYFAATTYDASGLESDFSNEATYTPNVPVNYTPPTLAVLSNRSVAENVGMQTVNLSGITLGTGSTLNVTASSSNPGLIPNPGINYTSPSSSGSLVFIPAQNMTGTATITVTADNGQPQDNIVVRTFVVTVFLPNQPPTLDPVGDLTMDYSSAGQVVNLTGIGAGASGENQHLTITAQSSNAKLMLSPHVSYVSGQPTGSLTVKPLANVSGTTAITVTVNDGGKSNNIVTRTFTVTVLPNYLPTLDPVGDLTMDYSSAGQVVNLTGIGAGASGENQHLTITAQSSNAKLMLSPHVSYVSGQTTGSLTVKPLANVSGTTAITVTVNDGGKSNNIVTRTFTVTVLPNDLPTLDPVGDLTMDYSSAGQVVNLPGIGAGASGENQRLTITAQSSNAKLMLSPHVSYVSGQPTGSLTVKPLANVSGTSAITVTVNDGGKSNNIVTRTFTVTVLPNYLPTLDPVGDLTMDYSSAGQVVNLTGIGAGASGENQHLTITAQSSNAKLMLSPHVSYVSGQPTGSLTVKPVANVSGTTAITVTVNDGGKSNNIVTRTFTVTVLPNYLPTLDPVGDLTMDYSSAGQVVNLTGIGAGASGENQHLTITAQSSNAKLMLSPHVSYVSGQPTGSLTVKPVANVSGTTAITVTVNDGGKSNNIVTRTFTVTVLPNYLPTLDPVGDVTMDYSSAGQVVNLTGIGAGASGENQRLTITAQSSNAKLMLSPHVSYVSGQTTGSLTVKPVANVSGTTAITVTVNDGGKSNNIVTRTFTVTVLPEVSPSIAQSPVVNSVSAAAVLLSAMTVNGQFSLTVNGVSGYQYTVEASLDLIHWTPIYTNTAPFTYEDDQTSQYSGQFYRAVYQP